MNSNAVVNDLGNAIQTVEGILHKLWNKEEICISDIESSLYEWRGTLFKETDGHHPLFIADGKRYKFSMVDNNKNEVKFSFVWPDEAMEPIRSVVVSEGVVYVSSADTGEILAIPVNDSSSHCYIIPAEHYVVRVGKINMPVHCVQASKTNLHEVVQ